jgi:two-component system alkaline phosphatase synthesis response regulator PhoP
LALVKQELFDLMILDVMVPYINGFDVCKEIRGASNVPILMLTARSSVEDRVKGLQIGADDYLVKPFDFEELKARIDALLRRTNQPNDFDFRNSRIVSKDKKLIVNKLNKQVIFCGNKLELTSKEYSIIELLAGSPNKIFTREEILFLAWDYSEILDVRAIDSHIKNIRLKFRKLQSDGSIIKTVWGIGYQFEMKGSENEA